ncbi:hypothetical protein KUTeg_024161 [Tegillarca granosa]|uniref:Uncharacterized protein n=1 Tax=Tegillarca granosa TaxID=220873 RepID=A0ABQ9E279_TEGGR|nr:hypothetical protein KUTeg_024161 [Tegillarca granosa]
MSVNCDDEDLETDNAPSRNDYSPLSLLSFADMTLALEAHKYDKDHTYCMNDVEIEITDSERLLNKEKDHNYSYFSKTLQPRGRTSKIPHSVTEPRRSSSEENLNRNSNSSDRISSQDFPVTSVSRKSHSLEKMSSKTTELSDFLVQVGIPIPGFSGLVVSSGSEENILNEKVLGSSWPKETTADSFRKKNTVLKSKMHLNPPSYCDHTYARDQLSIQNKRNFCGCDSTNKTDFDSSIRTDFKINADHNYTVTTSEDTISSVSRSCLTVKEKRCMLIIMCICLLLSMIERGNRVKMAVTV